ncbi:MAG: restriction endonuclease [Emcibacteraceae bacterium]|nr:restriction endonuclease [Emcibacteraceae bacterium]MDG1859761.1 restriction endonuclease [Emcibacteraceae bacterium]
MSKKKTGKKFEKLTQKVFELLSRNESYTTVEQNVIIKSQDGPRQFDVVIKSKVGSIDLLTVVECRDYNKALDITHIDGLYSKQQDVNANKAVLVARKGFSRSAKAKALRLGITLCTVHDMEGDLENIGFQIPIVFTLIRGMDFSPSFTFNLKKRMSLIKPICSILTMKNLRMHLPTR